jgi:hypothetical protein
MNLCIYVYIHTHTHTHTERERERERERAHMPIPAVYQAFSLAMLRGSGMNKTVSNVMEREMLKIN